MTNIKKKATLTNPADFLSKKKEKDVVEESKSPNKVKAMLKEKESPVNQFKIDDYDDSDDSADEDAIKMKVSQNSIEVGEMMSDSSDEESGATVPKDKSPTKKVAEPEAEVANVAVQPEDKEHKSEEAEDGTSSSSSGSSSSSKSEEEE